MLSTALLVFFFFLLVYIGNKISELLEAIKVSNSLKYMDLIRQGVDREHFQSHRKYIA